MKKNLSPNSKIIIANGIALFVGSIFDTVFHKHHAIQITFGIDEKFDLQSEDELIQSRAIIIDSDTSHRLMGKGGTQALLLIEPESLYGAVIRNTFGNENNIFNTEHIFKPIFYRELSDYILSEDFPIKEILNLIFAYLDISIPDTSIIDRRLGTIVELIEKNNEKKIAIEALASHVSLSESRLQHLFKAQMGISIKRYLLWKRMMDGIKIIANGNNFTFSAHESGFSDSSHMSRTCKEMFGITLSDLFKNSSSVQVIFEDY